MVAFSAPSHLAPLPSATRRGQITPTLPHYALPYRAVCTERAPICPPLADPPPSIERTCLLPFQGSAQRRGQPNHLAVDLARPSPPSKRETIRLVDTLTAPFPWPVCPWPALPCHPTRLDVCERSRYPSSTLDDGIAIPQRPDCRRRPTISPFRPDSSGSSAAKQVLTLGRTSPCPEVSTHESGPLLPLHIRRSGAPPSPLRAAEPHRRAEL